MLRVLVDATSVPQDRGGVGRYLDGLLPALSAVSGLSVAAACQQADVELFRSFGVEVYPLSQRVRSRPVRLGWEQVGLPRLAARSGADLVHCPHYTMPIRTPLARTVTLHDATFFSDPQVHTAVKSRFFRAATRFAVHSAEALVVPSAATRDQLSALVSPRAAGAFVAHHGVDTSIFRPPTAEEVHHLRQELDLGASPFIAFLGTLEPRKNVPALIRAWQHTAARRPQAPILVLAGGKGWDEEVEQVIAAVPPPLRIVRPGYLALAMLPALLGGAELVCYPALGEGFGLPVLEAMACGAVTVTTDRLALPEVGGAAVEYCSPDAAGISEVLSRLLANPGRCAELRDLGVARAKTFTWAAAAQTHLQAYELAVERGPHGARR